MNKKVQLIHPAGKKAVSIDNGKYELLKKSITGFLSAKGELTHTELVKAITEALKKDKVKFEGSLAWYLEWVMLDLEARKEIRRTGKAPVKFMAS